MFAFLKRTIVILVGFLLIALFIWFVGPYFAFGSYSPLEPVTNRLIAIGAVVALWLVQRLVKRLRASRAGDRLMAAVVSQKAPETGHPSADAVKLRERFEEAVASLKQQPGGHGLYDLPWYVIIGAPGSGKTTALRNSGLKFPLESRVGKDPLRGVGGTRNCDWLFTDQAIFLDTAGRYTTQDSDATSDSAGWTEFLALLKKYRVRRPINGVILTIDAQDLLVRGASARESHVDASRRRLDELNRELGIQLPVYLMVTKCDLVAGFTEYFDDLSPEGRAQVWGVTFDYDQSLNNEGPELLPEEFDGLMMRLNERVFTRVEDSSEPRRRTRVFAFPQQMASLREQLTQFVSEVFATNRFDRRILLRGVYFTSGTQDGTPIDRLLGSIGRRFGTADAVVPSSGPGKAYFVQQLLSDVMIGESGLAGVNRRLEARKAAVQLGAYAATGLVAASGLAAMSVSYSRNQAFLEQTGTQLTAFEQTPPATSTSPFERILPRLDAMKAIVDSSEAYRTETMWAMRWGLHQGSAIGNAARDAYVRELDGILLPRVGTQLRARLEQSFQQPEKLFQYLKGYLMLGEPKRLDPAYLKLLTDPEWAGAGGATSPTAAALASHFDHLLANSGTLRPLGLDGTLVTRARTAIRQTSMARILYDSISRSYADDQPPLVLANVVSTDIDRLFRRRSGAPMSTPISSFYTRRAFERVTREGRAGLVATMANEGWVLGDGMGTLADAGTLVSQVTALYEADYIRAWDALIDDLAFARFPTVAQLSEALRVLSGPMSPLRRLLDEINRQTALVDAATTAAAPKGRIEEATKSATDMLNNVLRPVQRAAGVSTIAPGSMITAHFQWVRQLTTGEPGKQPIDGIMKTMSDIQVQLATLGPDVAGAGAASILTNPSFRTLRDTFRQQSEALPPGLRNLFAEIGGAAGGIVVEEATEKILELYNAQVLPTCVQLIENRYPFATSTGQDVPLPDFASLFGPQGTFGKFFAEHLEKQVDTTRSPWRLIDGSVTVSTSLLGQFQAAREIRDTFFPAGAKGPEVGFFVTISDLDSQASRFVVEVDGQIADDRHQPAVRRLMKWPGARGEAKASFESLRFNPPMIWGGSWAWFRMIDATIDGPADAQQRIRLNVQNQYHRVRVTVESERPSSSPFAFAAWRKFSCRP